MRHGLDITYDIRKELPRRQYKVATRNAPLAQSDNLRVTLSQKGFDKVENKPLFFLRGLAARITAICSTNNAADKYKLEALIF